jgi:hypothetical protein
MGTTRIGSANVLGGVSGSNENCLAVGSTVFPKY